MFTNVTLSDIEQFDKGLKKAQVMQGTGDACNQVISHHATSSDTANNCIFAM